MHRRKALISFKCHFEGKDLMLLLVFFYLIVFSCNNNIKIMILYCQWQKNVINSLPPRDAYAYCMWQISVILLARARYMLCSISSFSQREPHIRGAWKHLLFSERRIYASLQIILQWSRFRHLLATTNRNTYILFNICPLVFTTDSN